MEEIIDKIIDLYESEDGGAGGYGHIVFDDGNYDSIEGCIKDAEEGNLPFYNEDCRQKSLIALKAVLPLSEDEIHEIMKIVYKRLFNIDI